MKQFITVVGTVSAVALTLAACSHDAGLQTDNATSTSTADSNPPAASVPQTIIPAQFESGGGGKTFDARKAFDLTGDGRPETLVVHAAGPYADSASVTLAILDIAGDTLYQDRWNTRSYFAYTPRKGLTDSAASEVVVGHLRRLLADSAFTSNGPSDRLKSAATPRPPGAKASAHEVPGIDRDAIRYDIKYHAVRAQHALKPGDALLLALPPKMYDEMEKYPVAEASIDSLADELEAMPTFTYYAGGEVTYTIAWSNTKRRFVKIFSCC
jgi:hypothetical protein